VNSMSPAASSMPLPDGGTGMPDDATLQHEAERAFRENPVAFIRQEIRQAVEATILSANEDGQARVAMEELARQNPGAAEFMPLIIAEVKDIIANDDDGVLAPWPQLFQQGLERLTLKLEKQLKGGTTLKEATPTAVPKSPFVEAGTLPTGGKSAPPPITRDSIARMSLEEFMRHEASIKQAFRNGQVK
jgi:hypothetical protein